MEHLVIRLPEHGASAQWAVFDGDGRVVRQLAHGPLEDAAALAGGRRVTALVPGVEVVMTETQLPKTSPARLRKMLPYSLEDALAEDVEALTFAVGRRSESGEVAVAIVAREKLDAWLEQLAVAGVTPHAVQSDAEGVPDTPSTLTLIIEDERVYGRVPERPPFVFDGMTLDEILEIVDGAGEAKAAVVYVDENGRARYAEELRLLGERIASTQVKLMGDGALYRLGSTVSTQPGTNLLQGPYAPRSDVAAFLRPWRTAAGLLIGLVLVTVLAQASEYWSLRQQDRALTERLTDSCRQALSAPSLDACENAVRARLGRSGLLEGGDDGFLAALAAVAESRGPDMRLEGLSYRNRMMDLRLLVPDVPTLDALAREIESGGRFDVVVQTTNPGDDGVESQVQLVGAGE